MDSKTKKTIELEDFAKKYNLRIHPKRSFQQQKKQLNWRTLPRNITLEFIPKGVSSSGHGWLRSWMVVRAIGTEVTVPAHRHRMR